MKEPVIMVKDWKEEAEMGDPPQTRPPSPMIVEWC